MYLKFHSDPPGANELMFLGTNITLIPTWISNYICYKVCDEITYPFPWCYNTLTLSHGYFVTEDIIWIVYKESKTSIKSMDK